MSSRSRAITTAKCPGCKKRIVERPDGTLRAHGGRGAGNTIPITGECPGSYRSGTDVKRRAK